MTELRDDTDDLIRTAIHDLVATAPDPKPLPEPVVDTTSRRGLAVAASIIAVVAVGGAIALVARDDGPGTIASPTQSTALPTAATAPEPITPAWWPDEIESVGATLIGQATDGGRIEIEPGSSAGVEVGMPLVDDEGLLGIVIDTNPDTAIVRLIGDLESQIDVAVDRSDADDPAGVQLVASAVAVGDGQEGLALSDVELFDGESLRPGDTLLTVTGPLMDWRVGGIPIGIVDSAGGVIAATSINELTSPLRVITDDMRVPERLLEEMLYGPPRAALDGAALTDVDGEPYLTSGVVRQIAELDGRRLAWTLEPSGAAWSYLSAWIDDGDGWEFVDLADQFGVAAEDEQPVVGDWPVAIATDGTIAVAVGADATVGEDGVTSEPRIWFSEDLTSWEVVGVRGPGRLDDVVSTDDGWVAVGEIDGQQAILRSANGRVWERSLAMGSTEGFERPPTVARVADHVVVTFGHGMIVHSDDGVRGWSDAPLGANPIIYEAGPDRLVQLEQLQLRLSWSTDGTTWELVDDQLDEWLDPDIDPRRLQFAHVAVEESLLVTDGVDLWKLRPGELPQEYDLTQHLPDTQWGPSYITGLQVLDDGTVVVLGAIPHEPGTKPINEVVVLTSDGDPSARARDAAVRALVSEGFVDIGGDHDIPGSATFGVEDRGGEWVSGTFTTVESDLPTNALGLCNGYTMTIDASDGSLATIASDIVERALRC